MKKITSFVAFWLMILTLPLTAYAIAWPGAEMVRHNDIVLNGNSYEPSGVVWNPLNDKLFAVGDSGQITMMNLDGSEQETKSTPVHADYEALAIADPTTNVVYI
nr:hypothetical protein [Candidatus Paceibacterota bacterium]